MQKLNSTLLNLLFLSFVAFSIWSFAFSKPDGKLYIDFLDVGQGDAIYFSTPDGYDGLIDGGPNYKVLNELGKSMAIGDRVIDLLMATHPDSDHIGGLDGVLERYEIKEIWINDAVHTTETYIKFLEAVKKEKEQGAIVKVVTRGDRKEFGETSLQVLAPFESFEGKQPEEQNEGSIVARLKYKNFSVLLTGDAEFALEDRLVASASDIFPLQSTILKVGHHGSAGSTSDKFIEAVKPETAVISVGKNNRFNHPAQRVLDLLNNKKISIYRTDEIGTVKWVSDGENYQCVSC